MRILITNIRLDGRTGTELYVRDVALHLQRRGHRVQVYTPRPGELARELRSGGIDVVSRPGQIRPRPDIIHGHHDVATMVALRAAPGVPGIFVVHDQLAAMDEPPRHPRLRRYVAVGANTAQRLACGWIDPATCSIIGNGVDLERFAARTTALPPRPRRALVFSNYACAGTHLTAVQSACDAEGIQLDSIGQACGRASRNPETQLGLYDIVFAKGRAALEAAAVGCAVVVCDARGVGPMVTRAHVEDIRRWNFGMTLMTAQLDVEVLRARIAAYDAADAAAVSSWVRSNAGIEQTVTELVRLYETVVREHATAEAGIDAAEDAAWRTHRSQTRARRLRTALAHAPLVGPVLTRLALRAGLVEITALPPSEDRKNKRRVPRIDVR